MDFDAARDDGYVDGANRSPPPECQHLVPLHAVRAGQQCQNTESNL